MIRHEIYLYTSDDATERIALVTNDKHSSAKITEEELRKLREKYDFATHSLFTDSSDLKSIVLLDPFFEGVEFYTELDSFLDKLATFKKISLPTPVEFSNILLARSPLDKLQLQKVLYLIYSICLDQGEKIFREQPLAYKYGPVYRDVLREYYNYRKSEKIYKESSIIEEISLSKSLDINKVFSIMDIVLKLIENKSGGNLIEVTHAENGPWDQVYVEGKNAIIEDEVILKYNYHVIDKLKQPIY